jgi:hypothetical protein
MPELVKIKQVENLETEIASIQTAINTANAAMQMVSDLNSLLSGITLPFPKGKEVFTGITALTGEVIPITVAFKVVEESAVMVFVNGIHVEQLNVVVGSDRIEFKLPFDLTSHDTIIVYYTYSA